MSNTTALLVSVFLIVANGFFVGVELAFVASRRTKLESMAETGAFGSRKALVATSNITQMLFAAQLGITICSLILGLIAEAAVADIIESALDSFIDIPESVLHGIGFAVALLLVVFVHTVFGEMVPKTIAIAQPETASRFLAPVHLVVVAIVRPIIWVLKLLAKPLLRLAGVQTTGALNTASTPEELVRLLDASREGGLVEEQEHALLVGALDFGDIRVRSVMIPQENIVKVAMDTTIREIERTIVESGHTRIPVVRPDDSILGFVHSKDILRLPIEAQNEAPPFELIRRMVQVGTDWKLEDVLVDMKQYRTHMALVLAPDHRVIGMLTLEDILEELVGEIYDESDQDKNVEIS